MQGPLVDGKLIYHSLTRPQWVKLFQISNITEHLFKKHYVLSFKENIDTPNQNGKCYIILSIIYI